MEHYHVARMTARRRSRSFVVRAASFPSKVGMCLCATLREAFNPYLDARFFPKSLSVIVPQATDRTQSK
jgi:hypothetical protein